MVITQEQFDESVAHLRSALLQSPSSKISFVDIIMDAHMSCLENNFEEDRTQEWFETYYNDKVVA